MKDFINKIKSPTLKKLFLRIINENYNIQALTYVMQALSKKDAGMVEGGSLKLANNMKKEFESKLSAIIAIMDSVDPPSIIREVAEFAKRLHHLGIHRRDYCVILKRRLHTRQPFQYALIVGK